MRLNKAIERADRMRPNTVSRIDKAYALLKLESEFLEMMGEDLPEWDLDSDDPELCAPEQFARVYPLYLMAFIDHEQEETDLYQIDMITANSEIAEFKAWYRRNNPQHTDVKFKGVFI